MSAQWALLLIVSGLETGEGSLAIHTSLVELFCYKAFEKEQERDGSSDPRMDLYK